MNCSHRITRLPVDVTPGALVSCRLPADDDQSTASARSRNIDTTHLIADARRSRLDSHHRLGGDDGLPRCVDHTAQERKQERCCLNRCQFQIN